MDMKMDNMEEIKKKKKKKKKIGGAKGKKKKKGFFSKVFGSKDFVLLKSFLNLFDDINL